MSSSGKSSTRRPARHGNAEHDAYLSRSATKNRLRCLRDVAAELKMTETISLIPTLANPKNLFGFIADHRDAQGPVLAAVALAA